MHPLIVHFPVALLLVAPILVLLGMLLPKSSRGLFLAAFVLMVLGTVATYFAVATGDAAGELAERTPGVAAVLESHEGLAESTRIIFTALSVIFAMILFAPLLFKRKLRWKSSLALNLAFLLFYSAGAVMLINVAHQGGRLVHELGVRAMMTNNATAASSASAEKSKKKQQRDDDE
jgi:uncharacterized membrane protein